MLSDASKRRRDGERRLCVSKEVLCGLLLIEVSGGETLSRDVVVYVHVHAQLNHFRCLGGPAAAMLTFGFSMSWELD